MNQNQVNFCKICEKEKLSIGKYLWSLEKPKDNDYGTILLMPGKTENGTEFIGEDFDLDSKHSWKRRFQFKKENKIEKRGKFK